MTKLTREEQKLACDLNEALADPALLKEAAAVRGAWASLTDPRARHGLPKRGIRAGRAWGGTGHSFNAIKAFVESFVWAVAASNTPEMQGGQDHFHCAMLDEIGEDDEEFNCVRNADDTNNNYRWGWIVGVVDAFVAMGGKASMLFRSDAVAESEIEKH